MNPKFLSVFTSNASPFLRYISPVQKYHCFSSIPTLILPSRDKIEKNEIGGACTAYGGEERRRQGFGGKA
jgi:hypothetical protein